MAVVICRDGLEGLGAMVWQVELEDVWLERLWGPWSRKDIERTEVHAFKGLQRGNGMRARGGAGKKSMSLCNVGKIHELTGHCKIGYEAGST